MAEASTIGAISTLAEALVDELRAAGLVLATAESCTGGWIAKAITDVVGSSDCFGFGFVSYSNAAKRSLLDVSEQTLRVQGAVSEATVREMAEGALDASGADLSVAVSGIAGPDGGTEEKPVGTVWFAWSKRSVDDTDTGAVMKRLRGAREEVRAQSVVVALQGLRERLRGDDRIDGQ